jgi:hypothetical protein
LGNQVKQNIVLVWAMFGAIMYARLQGLDDAYYER